MLVTKSCSKNREHEKQNMKYNYTKFYEIFCENMNFFSYIFK